MTISRDALERAKRVKLILMDVDGVLTDGLMYYLPGQSSHLFETKGFHSQDGLGLYFCAAVGIATGVISGRESPALAERAQSLKIKYVYQGLLKKQAAYSKVLAEAQVDNQSVAYIGDDLTDYPLMCQSGLSIAVSNARNEVKSIAHFVTKAAGGAGAVREAIEIILKAQNLWLKALQAFEIELK